MGPSPLGLTTLRTELTRQRPQFSHCSLDPLPNLSACTSVRASSLGHHPSLCQGQRLYPPAGLAPLKRTLPSSSSLIFHTYTPAKGSLGTCGLWLCYPTVHTGHRHGPQHSKKRALCLDPVCGFPPNSFPGFSIPCSKGTLEERWNPSTEAERQHRKKIDLKFPLHLPGGHWVQSPLSLCDSKVRTSGQWLQTPWAP